MEMPKHIPVLLKETVDALAVKKGGRYLDGTFGRGGHSREIARRGGIVLGIDRDDEAVAAGCSDEVRGLGIEVVKGRHGELGKIAAEHGWESVDGILLDLGVSSPQLDEAGRGFSFVREGPLDMRMDGQGGLTAADLVSEAGEERLTEIFREWGEEPNARRIAKAICRANGEWKAKSGEGGRRRFETTLELADFVEKLIGRRGGHHPATRIFQALRMEVNDEMGELERALKDGMDLLAVGGRFAVITFESLTDRVVKWFFAAHVGKMVSLQQGGARWEGETPKARAVTGKPVVAEVAELNVNPRSRSAKLRVIEKTEA